MRLLITAAVMATTLVASAVRPAVAQQQNTLVADLLTDVNQVQDKLVSLAKAFPANKYDWRPGEGVRSVGEVFLHLASDNYLLSAVALGVAAPASTGINPAEYNTVLAYEKRKLDPAAIVADMEQSFAHFKAAMAKTPTAKMGDKIQAFGQTFTVQQMLVLATTHLHEHLGQAIAYARTNGVVPPWSRGQ